MVEEGHSFRSAGDARIRAIRHALESVADPEIPFVSVVELGMIADVRIEADQVVVDVTPTFVACPAIAQICKEIREAVLSTAEHEVTVHIVYDPPWTSDRITEEGRVKLKRFGLAPPGRRFGTAAEDEEGVGAAVCCPYCDSTDTTLESLFGPTLCRSVHYCHGCLQSFERFKTV